MEKEEEPGKLTIFVIWGLAIIIGVVVLLVTQFGAAVGGS